MNSRQFQGNLTGVDNYDHSLSRVSDHLLPIACIFSLIFLIPSNKSIISGLCLYFPLYFNFSFAPYICSKIHLIFIYFYVNLIKHGLISCGKKVQGMNICFLHPGHLLLVLYLGKEFWCLLFLSFSLLPIFTWYATSKTISVFITKNFPLQLFV